MAQTNYLQRRGGTYFARLRVPDDVRGVIGKTELTKTLQTRDPSEAKRRVLPVIGGWLADFDDARARGLTLNDVGQGAWDRYTASLQRDEVERQHRPSPAQIDQAKAELIRKLEAGEVNAADPLAVLDASVDCLVLQNHKQVVAYSRDARMQELQQHLASNQPPLVAHEVTDFLERHHLRTAPASPEWKALSQGIARAEIEALARAQERDQGDYTGQPRDPIVRPPAKPRAPVAAPGESILEIFELFARENPRKVEADRLAQQRRDIGLFLDIVGHKAPMSAITRIAVRDWKQLLLRFPVKATESTTFKGMTLQEIVERNVKVGKPTLSDRTVNRYLTSLGAFCRWAVANGYLDLNPTTDMGIVKEQASKTHTFTSDQLNTIFRSPLFTGCAGTVSWSDTRKPGPHLIRDHRFWLPLLMLFTGARNGEVAQLAVDDVRQMHGRWVLHVTMEGQGDKRVKTAGSMRVVPIHAELIRLGLLDYHAAQKQAGHVQLFPGAKRNSRGQMLADFSTEFGKLLTSIGIKDGRGHSLYSFRHGVADALRRAGHLDEEFGFLMGHVSGTVTARYGNLRQGTLERSAELIESIKYPGLSLDHLISASGS